MFILNLKLLEYLVAMPLRMQNNASGKILQTDFILFLLILKEAAIRRKRRVEEILQNVEIHMMLIPHYS